MSKKKTPETFDYSNYVEIEIPIKGLGGVDYVMRPASGAKAAQFKNELAKRTELKGGKASGVKNIGDMEPMILSFTVWEEVEDTKGAEKLVSLDVVKGWPSPIIQDLATTAMEISGLGEKEDGDGEDEEGNSED